MLSFHQHSRKPCVALDAIVSKIDSGGMHAKGFTFFAQTMACG